jgi:hypothetical protein
MNGECSTHGRMRGGYRMLVGGAEGKRLLGRPRRRWQNSINGCKVNGM